MRPGSKYRKQSLVIGQHSFSPESLHKHIHAARQVACGLSEVVVDGVEETIELLSVLCAETEAAKAKAATVVKKRMLKLLKVLNINTQRLLIDFYCC